MCIRDRRFPVIQKSHRNGTGQHFLQAHRLGAELKAVGVVLLGTAALVLHRHRFPRPCLSRQSHTAERSLKLHHVAGAADAQAPGVDPQIPADQRLPPSLRLLRVMSAPVKPAALHRPKVVLPLPLQMDQRPLPAAVDKMLKPGQLQEILFGIFFRHCAIPSHGR